MSILDFIFPVSCLGCGKPGMYICSECLGRVQVLKPVCPYCEKASIDGFTHASCAKKYGLDGLTSIWKYEGVLKKAIQTLKYKYATEITRELCGYFVPQIHKSSFIIPNSSVLVPIPIYWYRENYRGFNQSVKIGKVVAEKMGWGFELDLLIKTKPTTSQAGLSVKDRKKNLRDVFAINPNYLLPVTNYLLFDDVFTTGSTLKEAAKVLKKNGASRVWGMTLAR